MTTPAIATAEELLTRLLCGSAADRIIVQGEILNAELGGLTVADTQCADRGRPLVLPLGQVWRHLRTAGAHDPTSMRLDSRDVDGYGPALGHGGTT